VKKILLIILLSSFSFSQADENKEFIELYLKIQTLEKEIASLRNELEVMQTQLDFYQNRNLELINSLDSRLTSVMSIEDLQKIEVQNTEETMPLNTYDEAVLLIRKGRLSDALNSLSVYIQNSPDSENTPLAYFWMGEINLTNENLAVATQNFNTLVGLYPTHWKVPLAKFKLGSIYLEQGSLDRAAAQFESVIREYPQSSAAKASSEALSSLE
tara:strand:+ start:67154 stop:67795 length:642 start_codon:yes stop_codon:yes gene_type:complete